MGRGSVKTPPPKWQLITYQPVLLMAREMVLNMSLAWASLVRASLFSSGDTRMN